MAFPLRILTFSLLASVALYGGACGDDPAPAEANEVDPALADVVFEGGATDEALEQLLAAAPVTDAAHAAIIDSPLTDSTLTPTPIPTFAWHRSGATASRPAERPSGRTAAFGSSWSAELLGERSAWAHGTPMSGEGYYLVFSTDADPALLRVFTTRKTYTPDDAAWAKLTSVGTWTQLTIVTGVFDQDHLAGDGGPFAGGDPILFCIER